MEENDTPNEDIEKGHQALNNLVVQQFQQLVDGIELGGVEETVMDLMQSTPGLSLADAITQAFQGLLQPVLNNLQSYSDAVIFYNIFNALGFGGEILAAIHGDNFQGSFFNVYSQTDLAATSDGGREGQPKPITFTETLAEPNPNPDPAYEPYWEYNVHGAAWQTIGYWLTPEGVKPGHWEISLVEKIRDKGGGIHLSRVGGTLPDGTSWYLMRNTAVGLIQEAKNSFYVVGADGSHSNVILSDDLTPGHFYLTTTPDRSKEDNLLSLPPLPALKWFSENK